MLDRKKIIEGLEHCASGDGCKGCPYNKTESSHACLFDCINDALVLLKEQESDEKNKECIEDQNAVECLNAIQTINKYIDDEEDECGCSYWKDRKGYEFKTDIGYFFEGLDNFEAYIIKRLRQTVK